MTGERGLLLAGLASGRLSDAPRPALCPHARHGVSASHMHKDKDTRTHGHLDRSHTDVGDGQRATERGSTCTRVASGRRGTRVSGDKDKRGRLGS